MTEKYRESLPPLMIYCNKQEKAKMQPLLKKLTDKDVVRVDEIDEITRQKNSIADWQQYIEDNAAKE